MSIKIDQAFLTAFIDADLGLPIAHENLPFTPVLGVAYAELLTIQNDITALSLADSNQTDGLFRVILRYPVNKGAIPAKLKADEIKAVFTIGARICFDGVCATVTRQDRRGGVAEDGWYKLLVTFRYKSLIQR